MYLFKWKDFFCCWVKKIKLQKSIQRRSSLVLKNKRMCIEKKSGGIYTKMLTRVIISGGVRITFIFFLFAPQHFFIVALFLK